jgi:hypothetical protein
MRTCSCLTCLLSFQRVSQGFDQEIFEASDKWTRFASRSSAKNQYDLIVDDAIRLVTQHVTCVLVCHSCGVRCFLQALCEELACSLAMVRGSVSYPVHVSFRLTHTTVQL